VHTETGSDGEEVSLLGDIFRGKEGWRCAEERRRGGKEERRKGGEEGSFSARRAALRVKNRVS